MAKIRPIHSAKFPRSELGCWQLSPLLTFSSRWLNQTIWKICNRQIGSFEQRWTYKRYVWNHHLVFVELSRFVIKRWWDYDPTSFFTMQKHVSGDSFLTRPDKNNIENFTKKSIWKLYHLWFLVIHKEPDIWNLQKNLDFPRHKIWSVVMGTSNNARDSWVVVVGGQVVGCWHGTKENFDQPKKKWGKLENIVYHFFFGQLWLFLGVKLMEINSNLFSRKHLPAGTLQGI